MKKFEAPIWVTLLQKWVVLALALSGFLGLGCNKDDGIGPGYDMAYQRTFEIPAGISVFDVHHFQLKNIPSSYDEYLNLHSKSDTDIIGVIPAQFTLSGIFGDADLSVIDRISVRVYDESNPNDYVEIAYRDPAPLDSGNTLAMIPSLADAKRFFSAPRFSVDVVIYLRKTTQTISTVRLDFLMRAKY